MTDYSELVKALRCKGLSKKCDSCGYGYHISPDSECNDACHFEQIAEDAAAAIEELQARLPKQGKWVRVEDGESYHYECSECGERPLYSRYGDVSLNGLDMQDGAKLSRRLPVAQGGGRTA